MKPHTLPVKRRPVAKGMFKRLSAVTGNRKQRVAATATPDMDVEDSGSKISRALTIIFLIHIVAIGLIFVHQRFLDGRTSDEPKAAQASGGNAATAMPAPRRAGLPQLSSGDVGYMPKPGDNYAKIAAAAGVDEGELRMINENVEIRPSIVLRIPPKRIVAQDPPEVVAIRQQQTRPESDSGLVEALPVDVRNAPRAQLVRPALDPVSTAPAPVTSGKNYVVQSGDSVWRIANRFGVKQEELMKANGITDARKMKTGMSLVIPR